MKDVALRLRRDARSRALLELGEGRAELPAGVSPLPGSRIFFAAEGPLAAARSFSAADRFVREGDEVFLDAVRALARRRERQALEP